MQIINWLGGFGVKHKDAHYPIFFRGVSILKCYPKSA